MDFSALTEKKRNFFRSGATLGCIFRIQQLGLLKAKLLESENEIFSALHRDLHKPKAEAFSGELALLYAEIDYAINNLPRWMKPEKTATPLAFLPGKSRVYSEPLGLVLIIAPWNYPLHLALVPLVGAIAAGNCVSIKPSELTPTVSSLIARLLREIYVDDYVSVVEGGAAETTQLLAEKWDHIFFTGNGKVGRLIMRAAAQHLTPVTLELGGKSPAIVTANADLDLAARRIVWGKFYNAGQTCVAPDYVFVHKSVSGILRAKLRERMEMQFGAKAETSQSFARIVSHRHWLRLKKFLSASSVVWGGQTDQKSLFIAPTLIYPASWDDPVMQEEIFGPLLPVMEFASLEELWSELSHRDKPLAAYFFSRDRLESEEFIRRLSFGGGCINDVVIHLSNHHLPFGGIGESGMGAYHGKASFVTFSHRKSIIKKSSILDLSVRYPPYTEKSYHKLRRLLRSGRSK